MTRSDTETRKKVLEKTVSALEGQIVRAQNIAQYTEFQCEAVLADIEPRLNEFREAEIYLRDVVQGDESEKLKQVRNQFEDQYFSLWAKLKERLKATQGPQGSASSNSSFDMTAFAKILSEQKDGMKCPKLEIPQFDGDHRSWMRYKDLFETLVHNNKKLSDTEKMQYLEMSMVKVPVESNVLTGYKASGDNYPVAWKAVCERYDSHRKLISCHLKPMFSSKRMANNSAEELRKLIDVFKSNISALENLSYPLTNVHDFGNMMVVHMVTQRLDDEVVREWRRSNEDEKASWEELLKFLNKYCASIEDLQSKPKPKPVEIKSARPAKSFPVNESALKATELVCYQCNGPHALWDCSQFLSLAVGDRRQFLRARRLCFVCFRAHQLGPGKCQSRFKCKTCRGNHHTLLHEERPKSFETPKQQAIMPPPTQTLLSAQALAFEPMSPQRAHLNVAHNVGDNGQCSVAVATQCLLSTVLIKVKAADGSDLLGRALLDSGSTRSFMTSQFARRLGFPLAKTTMVVTGISGKATQLKHSLRASLESRTTDYKTTAEMFIMDQITDNIPNQDFNVSQLDIPSEVSLADPNFWKSCEIDMLLDNQIYLDTVTDGRICTGLGIQLRRSHFGWIVGGYVPCKKPATSLLSAFSHVVAANVESDGLNEKLETFFESEHCEFPEKRKSIEEKLCEKLFQETTTRADDGRFVVKIPFKENLSELGTNRSNALRCLYAQESRRKRDSQYDKLYVKSMEDFVSAGHMSKVETGSEGFAHYLPHHGVMKLSSTSTKLRPVCNASSVSETGLSLNDVMCVGSTVQPESFDILMRFREKEFCLMADVTKMYLQIWVHPSQRKYLRLFWRSDMTKSIEEYQMNVVVFGTAAAPWLATRAIVQLSDENCEMYPKAAEVMKEAIYMDDALIPCESVEEGLQLREDLRHIFASAGMNLCKWSANHADLLKGLPDSLLDVTKDGENTISKALGVGFDSEKDEFFYTVKDSKRGKCTKAAVLSEIASLYDPNGWVGPVVLRAKIFMKELWMMKIDWKDEVSEEFQGRWDEFRFALTQLNAIRIRRHCVIPNVVRAELHGFGDASIQGYGAAVYVLSYDEVGNHQVSLLAAKSRVAPKNQKTLARLELCASVLVSQLVDRLLKILKTNFDSVTLWSDSTIVLQWITMLPARLSTYVGNRVALVQELTRRHTWKHIRGEDNPADVISRGLDPQEIAECEIWFSGPPFFRLPQEDWPTPLLILSEDDPQVVEEVKKCLIVTPSNDLYDVIENRYSNYHDLIALFLRINRATFSMKFGKAARQDYSLSDHKHALLTIVRIVQGLHFADYISSLKQVQELIHSESKDSAKLELLNRTMRKISIHQLSPFLDAHGILRVGGRLSQSRILTFEQKHQILLPSCRFTNLLLRSIHEKHLHVGQATMMSLVRDKFWIVRAKSDIRKVVHDCIVCFRAKPTSVQQYMGSLPADRVNIAPPFSSVAVDYAGFYVIKSGLTRNAPGTKAYVAVFKCMRTGSTHLELVSDLTSKAFIAALERFVSRRGLCAEVYSDNGTCFVGTDNELKAIVLGLQKDAVEWCTTQGIHWKFTTPAAPHAGGIYESAVKSMKHHLKRVLGQTLLTFERFTTILCKVEAILNSRPLTAMSNEPDDFRILTPGHFLIGRPLVSLPQRNFAETPSNRLDHWDGLQRIQQLFWTQWSKDYLHQLQPRPKNRRQVHEFSIGDIVLLKDNNLPPMRWSLGRIVRLFPNRKDKVVRNVEEQTMNGLKERHVDYLCSFPFNRDSEARERVASRCASPVSH